MKPTLRKYKPRKEMPLSEVKRLVAAAHLRQMEKLGMPQPKRKWGKFTFGSGFVAPKEK